MFFEKAKKPQKPCGKQHKIYIQTKNKQIISLNSPKQKTKKLYPCTMIEQGTASRTSWIAMAVLKWAPPQWLPRCQPKSSAFLQVLSSEHVWHLDLIDIMRNWFHWEKQHFEKQYFVVFKLKSCCSPSGALPFFHLNKPRLCSQILRISTRWHR